MISYDFRTIVGIFSVFAKSRDDIPEVVGPGSRAVEIMWKLLQNRGPVTLSLSLIRSHISVVLQITISVELHKTDILRAYIYFR
jgi:hypothetical protein